MRSSLRIWSFLVVVLGALGCVSPRDEGSGGGASTERADTTEGRPSPSCSRCLQACRVSLRSCRYVLHGPLDGEGYLRCDLDRGGCVNLCRYVCR